MNARKTSMYLHLVAKLRPEALDAILPHGPKISHAGREYLIAMAVKGFSAELGDRAAAQQLAGVQKALVTFAGGQLAADYGDDDWCGTPYPGKIPHPHFDPEPDPWSLSNAVFLNPQPLPPKELRKEIGGYLLMLSKATAQAQAAASLKSMGESLLSGKAAD